nr:uncharacterized protein C18orf63 isoform X2 [Crassostrea gigas]
MYGKENATAPVIVLAKCPPLDELLTISICITKCLNNTSSTFQPHVIRCRELIFTEPDIIATPAFNSDNTFQVVLKKTLYNTGKLQARFSKIGLVAGDPQPVTTALFQSCLHYTLLARIAPSWNKAGQWLIQGRDFLSHQGYLNAVKMELVVSHEQIHLSLTASAVRFPALQLCDIEVPARSHQKFLQDPDFAIRGESVGSPWCHVLPSMKRGEIVGISRQLPADGPFRSYKDIKRYWKNSYGYRLPDNDDDRIYYQINFRPLGPRIFTYPDVCLRSRDILALPRVDPRPILVTFLQDLKAKMSTLCGHLLQLQSRANYLLTELSSVTQKEKSDSSNLSIRNTASKKVIYRNFPIPPQHTEQNNSCSQTLSVQSQPGNIQQNKISTQLRDSAYPNPFPPNTPRQSPADQEPATSQTSCNINRRLLGPSQTVSSSSSQEPRIIPKFLAKKSSNTFTRPSSNPGSVTPPVVPVFKARTSGGQRKQRDGSGLASSSTETPSCTTPSTTPVSSLGKSLPPAPAYLQDSWSDTPGSVHQSSLVPPSVPRPTLPHTSLTPVHRATSIIRTPTVARGSSSCRTTPIAIATTSQNGNRRGFNDCPSQRPTPGPTAVESGDDFMTSPSLSTKKTSMNEQQCSGPTPAKKPRTKPSVQDVDVEGLAREGQLSKVNSVTLMAWLKSRGLQCKSKDKKPELVAKVLCALNVRISEQ